MSKAFVKDDSAAGDDDEDIELPELPAGARNYITPAGYGRLRDELAHLRQGRAARGRARRVVGGVQWRPL